MHPSYLLPFQHHLIAQVNTALDEVNAGKNSHGLLLVGASGTGKTFSLDTLCEQVGERLTPSTPIQYQPISPICRTSATTKADASTTAGELLRILGKPVKGSSRTGIIQLESDLLAALVARQVKMLVFEEFNNAMLSGSPQLRGQTARLLKNIWNMRPAESSQSWAKPAPGRGDARLVIVVSGTEELLKVFEKDKELGSRFSTIIHAHTLDFSPPESFKAFRSVLHQMAELEALTDQLDVNDDAMAARMLLACNSHLRLLEKLLQRTGTLRRRSEHRNVSMNEILTKAYEEVGGVETDNPFLFDGNQLAQRVSRRIQLLKNRKNML